MRTILTGVLAASLFGLYAAWSLRAQEPARGERGVVNKEFAEKVRAAAQGYEKFGRVDDRTNWAPALCAAKPTPGSAQLSKSEDKGTHGLKLYRLFVQDHQPYIALGQKFAGKAGPANPGQTIVKESWIPEKVEPTESPLSPLATKPGAPEDTAALKIPYTKDKNGDLFRCKEKAALFVMLKLDPSTPETDQGWVYGTATADGKQVTGAGRMQSCMGCHQKAPCDRLFGIPLQEP